MRIGSTQAAIARLEVGGVTPSLGTLRRIASALSLELVHAAPSHSAASLVRPFDLGTLPHALRMRVGGEIFGAGIGADDRLELILTNGRRLYIAARFDAAALQRLLEVFYKNGALRGGFARRGLSLGLYRPLANLPGFTIGDFAVKQANLKFDALELLEPNEGRIKPALERQPPVGVAGERGAVQAVEEQGERAAVRIRILAAGPGVHVVGVMRIAAGGTARTRHGSVVDWPFFSHTIQVCRSVTVPSPLST